MANFVVIVDSDDARRARYVRQVRPLLAPLEKLNYSSCAVDCFNALWAAEDNAPISSCVRGGAAAVMWGRALRGPVPERIDADLLAKTWHPGSNTVPYAFDGFYAATVFSRATGLIVGADLLGLFPVYYASGHGVIIVSSSPELPLVHPLFPAELDVAGLLGILLTHGSFEGNTLLSGVRRLKAAHALVWQPGLGPREEKQHEIPASDQYSNLPFAAHVNILDDVLDDAVRRHAPPESLKGITLSGGRDSRLLAGYARRHASELRALTIGRSQDYEVRCASPVARALSFEHRVASIGYERFPWAADLQAQWEHLNGGFSNIHTWGMIKYLRPLAPSFLSGHLTDVIVGGTGLVSGKTRYGRSISFDVFFPVTSGHLDPAVVKKLLRANGELVDSVFERIRATYETCSPLEAQQPWRFILAHTGRFHPGAVPWRLSFGSWPALPILDRRVLNTVGRLPAPSLANRRAQDEILRTRFPRLARLPLDRNSHNIEPLLPSFRHVLKRRLAGRLDPARLLRGRIGDGAERRYYYRMYDFNGAGWRAIRERAEKHRDQLADLFDMNELAEFVPPPHVTVDLPHSIKDSFGRKLLVGLMLWLGKHPL